MITKFKNGDLVSSHTVFQVGTVNKRIIQLRQGIVLNAKPIGPLNRLKVAAFYVNSKNCLSTIIVYARKDKLTLIFRK